jgi:4-diphosphocytidyl-2-C-methyl-D-erythritol kinase
MEKAVHVLAPAKVNLHLRVYGRRADGYHGLRSLFQAISLADDIVVGSLKQPHSIEIDGVFDCPPEKTTLYKSVLAFREATGRVDGVSIAVKKAIPAGGLGGGSSDAAAALLALDSLFGTGLGSEKLSAIGLGIGSDVPFFFAEGAALVSGRGEIVEKMDARDDYVLLVVFPGFPVSTQEAYGLLDRERPDDSSEPDPSPAELRELYRADPSTWTFANSFEPHVGGKHPAILSWLSLLKSEGASFVSMSGSGSTLFGVFGSENEAHAAQDRIKARQSDASSMVLAFPLARPISVI